MVPARTFAFVLTISLTAGCVGDPGSATTPAPDGGAVPLAPGPFSSWNGSFRSFDGATIAFTVFKPDGASEQVRVPVVLHGPGWGGSRISSPTAYATSFLDAGLGFVSMSPRGFDDSTGPSRVMDPEYEARDVMILVDLMATWDWVLLDKPGDPRLGATGVSYGGGFQWVTALEETRLTGTTRFDALAPQATWNDLMTSLNRNGVPKSAWLATLCAAGATSLAPDAIEGCAHYAAGGDIPVEVADELHEHGAAWYAENGIFLDVPVLVQQGATDSLFPLNEAWANYWNVLTPEARSASMFLTHRNGHSSLNLQPGESLPTNPCAGSDHWMAADFQALWYVAQLAGGAVDLGPRVRMATHEGECLIFDEVPTSTESYPVDPTTPAGTPVPTAPRALAVVPVASGPVTLAGLPRLHASVTAYEPEARLFFGLGVGTSPADVRVAGEQWMPWRGGSGAIEALELVGIVERVPEGSSLFLVVSGSALLYATHGNRGPVAAMLMDVVVELPVVAAGAP